MTPTNKQTFPLGPFPRGVANRVKETALPVNKDTGFPEALRAAVNHALGLRMPAVSLAAGG